MFVNTSEFGSKPRSQAHADWGEIDCNNEDNILFRLAYLITGDEAQAQDSIIAAYGLAKHSETPFREWRPEWATYATVKSAIEARLAEIRKCEDRHKSSDRQPPRHRPQVMSRDLPATTESVLCLDPEVVIAGLDPLARAVLVLRAVLRSSVRDCSIQLNVSCESVLAIQRRITTWLMTMPAVQPPILQRPA